MRVDPQDASGQIPRAATVVRSISILYNNSRVYGVKHPVFGKTLEEHMPSFQNALADREEIVLTFIKGKVRCGSLLLDPGSTVFQALAHTLEGMGVSCIRIRRGVSAEEVAKLIEILTTNADEVARDGLQGLLDRARVRRISYQDVSIDTTGDPSRAARIPKARPDRTAAKSASPAGTVFDLDDTSDGMPAGYQPGRESASAGPRASADSIPFKEFVAGSLAGISERRADIGRVADSISGEFEKRLNTETEHLRCEKETAVRRLENVKTVVFEKLESMGVMAVLVETSLSVLAMTSAARELLGNVKKLLPDSPLAQCVKARGAYMDITLKGKSITVQTIASDSSSAGEIILLLTLNPE